MFAKLGRFSVNHPWPIIAGWIVATVALVAFAPTIADITKTDQSDFLPRKYESIKAQDVGASAFATGSGDTSASIVVKRADGGKLTATDQRKVEALAQELTDAKIPSVLGTAAGPQTLSPNERIQLVNIDFRGSPDDQKIIDAVGKIRDIAGARLANTGLHEGVTGDAALSVDNQDQFDRALKIVGIATIVLIIVLLLIVYRSPIAALLPIVTILAIVLPTSGAVIASVGKLFGLNADSSLEIVRTIVLYGAGTDYIVFLLFRYRERLRAGDDPKQAMVTSVTRVGEAIASAAGAVIVAFIALLAASLGFLRTWGVGLAIAVAVMLVAALTLVPAVVSLLGTKVFWPSKSWQRIPRGSLPQRLGRLVARRPWPVALASGGLLVLLALGVFAFKPDYDQFSQLPQTTESAKAFKDLQTGFPAGALNPTQVYVRSDTGQPLDRAAVDRFAVQLEQADGVGSIMKAANENGEPTNAEFSSDGKVGRINLLLANGPYTPEALHTAGGSLRDTAHAEAPPGTTALVGGTSAIFADVQSAINRDLAVVFPLAGLLIAIILALLLRSLVAPLYLMLAVLLGFAAAIGGATIVFLGIGNAAGMIFFLPIVIYLFVVAIGTDYNILMIARLREEAKEGNEPRQAADMSVEHAGPSIAAAGLILAGTFASLMLAGLPQLTQLGFAVSLGIVLAAFVMSMFLVPSITALIGHRAWWPGHGDEPDEPAAEVRQPAGITG